MSLRPIVLYPDPVLLRPTEPIATIDESVRTLVRDMVETMHAAPGIGLAANQIGVPSRVCVIDLSGGEDASQLIVLINPRIVSAEGKQVGEEGCLSFPGITLDVERPFTVAVDALDLEGRSTTLRAEALLARAIAHECEHLDGRVFLQNVSPLRRELVKKQIRKRIKAGEWEAGTPV
jgi:peptide deformylase